MERDIDLTEFGMCAIKCKSCGNDLNLTEINIDCDLKTHHPMSFEIDLYCNMCEMSQISKFKIIEIN